MGRQVYTSGSGTWTVPAGVTSVVIKAWGAGAGGGAGGIGPTGDGNGGYGAGGGYVVATFSVSPSDEFAYRVGGPGGGGNAPATLSGGGGGGGGSSTVFEGATPKVIAAGGGAGGGGDNSSAVDGGNGGGGGGTTGGSGTASSGAGGAAGGTQAGGGAGGTGGQTSGENGETDGRYHGGDGGHGNSGTGGGGTGGTTNGGAGGLGDAAAGFAGGGGGGEGYYGGGGGSSSVSGDAGGGGGGGGSNYYDPAATNVTDSQAANQTPPGTGDAAYQGSAGVGGAGSLQGAGAGSSGNAGLVVFEWGLSSAVGKTVDGWSGAVPVYGTLLGISEETYPYCRAKVVTPAAETYYTEMPWDSDASNFRGTIYPGSWYGIGCADPNTGSNSVEVQLSGSPDFTSVDYTSVGAAFTTYITRRKNSKGVSYDYTDPNASLNEATQRWDYTVSDFMVYADTNRNNTAIAIPFHPITADIEVSSVSFDGTAVSQGDATSTVDAWWWDSTQHSLYIQDSTIGTTEVDVDITFTSDTDLWMTRFDRVQTPDIGNRLFYNGLFISNKYLTTSIIGGGHIHAGMQCESRAKIPVAGQVDVSADCFERVAVHVDSTVRTDNNASYNADIKWRKDQWADYILSESNEHIDIVNDSDPTTDSGWRQQQDTGISAHRIQTYYSEKRYIKNVYELANSDTSSHDYPFVWQREQWLSNDRELNDRGRFYGDVSDATMDSRSPMVSYDEKWLVTYDTTAFVSGGVIFDDGDTDVSTFGIFKLDAFLLAGSPYAEWPVDIQDRTSVVAENHGFEHTFSSVAADSTVSLTFFQFLYLDGTSYANIESAISLDYFAANSQPVISNMGTERFLISQPDVDIEGVFFEDVQGLTGKVELGDSTNYDTANLHELSVNSWDNTNINVNISLGNLPAGQLQVYVTNNSANTSPPYQILVSGLLSWGYSSAGALNTSINWCRTMGGQSPDLDGMLLRSISIYQGTAHTTQARLAVYSGGVLATGPDTASLLWDAGQTAGTATNAWYTIEQLGDDIMIPKDTPLWLAFKGNDAGFDVRYDSTFPTASDFQSARGRFASGGEVSSDEAVAYPSTWPADTGAFADFWYSIYVQYTIKAYGYGMRFRAGNEEILTSTTTFTPPASCSVSFWVYNMDSQDGRILSQGNDWEIYFNGTKIVNDMNWASVSLTSNSDLNISNLYHVVMTRTSGARQIFINGALDNSDGGDVGSPSAATLYIGQKQTGVFFLDAYLEDVRIYNRVLSAGEIQTIYALKGIDNITYGLLHRYPLNELPQEATASGAGSVKDYGPEQNNMTPTNGPEYTGSRIRTMRLS